MEDFKKIPFFSRYEANSRGIIRRVSDKFTPKVTVDAAGYHRIWLYNDDNERKMRLVHRLVALAHLGVADKGWEVNHKDADKSNNRVENLEWVTKKGNTSHAVENNLYNPAKGEEHFNSVLTKEKVDKILELMDGGVPQWKIAEDVGVSQPNVSYVVNGHLWGHYTGIKPKDKKTIQRIEASKWKRIKEKVESGEWTIAEAARNEATKVGTIYVRLNRERKSEENRLEHHK